MAAASMTRPGLGTSPDFVLWRGAATLQIQTQGASAFGFLAQSVGGGGGIATAQNASPTGTYVGNGNALIENDGGAIGITFDGGSQISTTGDNAHAIFAQSVGGGGGAARGV